MEYFAEIVDTATGEVTKVSLGDWITITELGRQQGAGPKQTRTLLLQLGFFSIEGEGREDHRRHRVSEWVAMRGWAKRLKKGRFPFDVVSPAAQDWVALHWAGGTGAGDVARSEAQRRAMDALAAQDPAKDMTTACKVSWLLDHHPDLLQSDMALCLGVSQPLISRYKAAWRKRLPPQKALTDHQIAPQGCAVTL